MDSAKMCRILAYGCFFLLIVLKDPTEACMCAFQHPQSAYCYAYFVIRARFLGEMTQLTLKIYEIKTMKVYKGPETLKELRFIYTSRRENLCGYQHKGRFEGEEFIITGRKHNGRFRVSLCNFIQPWNWLSPEQKQGISKTYSRGCSCEIKPYYCESCPKTTGCSWDRMLTGTQTKKLACLPQYKSYGRCSWQLI